MSISESWQDADALIRQFDHKLYKTTQSVPNNTSNSQNETSNQSEISRISNKIQEKSIKTSNSFIKHTISVPNGFPSGGRIKVVCRFRPQLLFEVQRRGKNCAFMSRDQQSVRHDNDVLQGGHEVFKFDRVFGPKTSQQNVYEEVGQPAVTALVDGYNVAILAYGQTAAGKTHTMEGPFEAQDHQEGLIPRIADSLFSAITHKADTSQLPSENGKVSLPTETQMSHLPKSEVASQLASENDKVSISAETQMSHLHKPEQQNSMFTMTMSVVELYAEKLHDLLAHLHPAQQKNQNKTSSLRVIDDIDGQTFVYGAVEVRVQNPQDIVSVTKIAAGVRAVSATKSNAFSSRSHVLTTVSLIRRYPSNDTTTVSRLLLVDLAGAESAAKLFDELALTTEQIKLASPMKATAMSFHSASSSNLPVPVPLTRVQPSREASTINQSITTLGTVVNALAKKPIPSHIPYRDSKLTRLLRCTLGQKCLTTIVLAVSPSSYNRRETRQALKFGEQARKVRNIPGPFVMTAAEAMQLMRVQQTLNKSILATSIQHELNFAQIDASQRMRQTRTRLANIANVGIQDWAVGSDIGSQSTQPIDPATYLDNALRTMYGLPATNIPFDEIDENSMQRSTRENQPPNEHHEIHRLQSKISETDEASLEANTHWAPASTISYEDLASIEDVDAFLEARRKQLEKQFKEKDAQRKLGLNRDETMSHKLEETHSQFSSVATVPKALERGESRPTSIYSSITNITQLNDGNGSKVDQDETVSVMASVKSTKTQSKEMQKELNSTVQVTENINLNVQSNEMGNNGDSTVQSNKKGNDGNSTVQSNNKRNDENSSGQPSDIANTSVQVETIKENRTNDHVTPVAQDINQSFGIDDDTSLQNSTTPSIASTIHQMHEIGPMSPPKPDQKLGTSNVLASNGAEYLNQTHTILQRNASTKADHVSTCADDSDDGKSPQYVTVRIHNGPLGFHVRPLTASQNGCLTDTIISSISDTSPVKNLLFPGDQMVVIQGENVMRKRFDLVVQLLKACSRGLSFKRPLLMTVLRPSPEQAQSLLTHAKSMEQNLDSSNVITSSSYRMGQYGSNNGLQNNVPEFHTQTTNIGTTMHASSNPSSYGQHIPSSYTHPNQGNAYFPYSTHSGYATYGMPSILPTQTPSTMSVKIARPSHDTLTNGYKSTSNLYGKEYNGMDDMEAPSIRYVSNQQTHLSTSSDPLHLAAPVRNFMFRRFRQYRASERNNFVRTRDRLRRSTNRSKSISTPPGKPMVYQESTNSTQQAAHESKTNESDNELITLQKALLTQIGVSSNNENTNLQGQTYPNNHTNTNFQGQTYPNNHTNPNLQGQTYANNHAFISSWIDKENNARPHHGDTSAFNLESLHVIPSQYVHSQNDTHFMSNVPDAQIRSNSQLQYQPLSTHLNNVSMQHPQHTHLNKHASMQHPQQLPSQFNNVSMQQQFPLHFNNVSMQQQLPSHLNSTSMQPVPSSRLSSSVKETRNFNRNRLRSTSRTTFELALQESAGQQENDLDVASVSHNTSPVRQSHNSSVYNSLDTLKKPLPRAVFDALTYEEQETVRKQGLAPPDVRSHSSTVSDRHSVLSPDSTITPSQTPSIQTNHHSLYSTPNRLSSKRSSGLNKYSEHEIPTFHHDLVPTFESNDHTGLSLESHEDRVHTSQDIPSTDVFVHRTRRRNSQVSTASGNTTTRRRNSQLSTASVNTYRPENDPLLTDTSTNNATRRHNSQLSAASGHTKTRPEKNQPLTDSSTNNPTRGHNNQPSTASVHTTTGQRNSQESSRDQTTGIPTNRRNSQSSQQESVNTPAVYSRYSSSAVSINDCVDLHEQAQQGFLLQDISVDVPSAIQVRHAGVQCDTNDYAIKQLQDVQSVNNHLNTTTPTVQSSLMYEPSTRLNHPRSNARTTVETTSSTNKTTSSIVETTSSTIETTIMGTCPIVRRTKDAFTRTWSQLQDPITFDTNTDTIDTSDISNSNKNTENAQRKKKNETKSYAYSSPGKLARPLPGRLELGPVRDVRKLDVSSMPIEVPVDTPNKKSNLNSSTNENNQKDRMVHSDSTINKNGQPITDTIQNQSGLNLHSTFNTTTHTTTLNLMSDNSTQYNTSMTQMKDASNNVGVRTFRANANTSSADAIPSNANANTFSANAIPSSANANTSNMDIVSNNIPTTDSHSTTVQLTQPDARFVSKNEEMIRQSRLMEQSNPEVSSPVSSIHPSNIVEIQFQKGPLGLKLTNADYDDEMDDAIGAMIEEVSPASEMYNQLSPGWSILALRSEAPQHENSTETMENISSKWTDITSERYETILSKLRAAVGHLRQGYALTLRLKYNSTFSNESYNSS